MTRVGLKSLGEVDSSTGECGKPNCTTGSRTLHRHHRRHEAMWLGVWAGRRKAEPRYVEFIERYRSFDRSDWERLCDNHHAEIHLLYDEIIKIDKKTTKRPLSKYSWKQAERLMSKLEDAFYTWVKIESPGFSSEELAKQRQREREARQRNYRPKPHLWKPFNWHKDYD